MATTKPGTDEVGERLTVAPIVGPDDPRRFTDSGIEVKPLYTEDDLRAGTSSWASRASSRTRAASTARCTASSTWTMRQYAGYASAKESNERYRYLLSKGSHGPVDGLRPAHAARPGLRRPALPRRGRPHRRRDRHDRRHADGLRRHPARPGLDVDDDQRAGGGACCCSTSSSARSRASRASSCAGTTQNDVLKEYIARGNYIYPPQPTMRLTTDLFAYCNEHIPKLEHGLDLGLPLPREGRLRRPGGRLHAVAAGSPTCRPRSTPGLAVDDFAPAPGLLLQRPQQRLPGGREVPRRPADVGAHHARPLRRAGPEVDDAALPHADRRRDAHRPAAGEQHRRASRCRASPPSAAARSRCTPTATTRRSRCPPSARRRSRCAPSRCSPTSPARPTRSTRSPAPTTSRR